MKKNNNASGLELQGQLSMTWQPRAPGHKEAADTGQQDSEHLETSAIDDEESKYSATNVGGFELKKASKTMTQMPSI